MPSVLDPVGCLPLERTEPQLSRLRRQGHGHGTDSPRNLVGRFSHCAVSPTDPQLCGPPSARRLRPVCPLQSGHALQTRRRSKVGEALFLRMGFFLGGEVVSRDMLFQKARPHFGSGFPHLSLAETTGPSLSRSLARRGSSFPRPRLTATWEGLRGTGVPWDVHFALPGVESLHLSFPRPF